MTNTLLTILTTLTLVACEQTNNGTTMTTPSDAIQQLEDFKTKEKFLEDMQTFYPGLADPTLEEPLTAKINQAADDFIEVAKKDNPTDKGYQVKIGLGLSRFPNDLDTEDRERVAQYFQELMDIVGLESSDGQLNKFIYGFDPTELKNE